MGIEQIVEQVVSQVLESHVPKLQQALVQRVLDELPAQLNQQSSGGSSSNAGSLLKAISNIHEGGNQKEILRALLDGTTEFSSRAALFVVKSGVAVGWQGHGFEKNDEIKDFALDVSSGLGAHAMEQRTPAAGNTSDADANFITNFGAPAENDVIVLPLLLKDKVAALVYADNGGKSEKLDRAALEVVVAATGAWLEVVSLRKQVQQKEVSGDDSHPVAVAQASPAYSDPFAGHAPAHNPAVTAAAVVEEEAPVAIAAAASASGSSVSVDAGPQLSPEDADTHRKAQRFARLLIDEIKLYNQVKVTEGRKHKDIYDRLKQDIEKSRSMYTKRYGNTAAASVDYFSAELVRSLAEDDSSLMGTNFQRK
ncbi:MAG TPA: hypothetical protein VGF44_08230 [Terriglobales bacterium]|jgi:hypothetical protein